MHMITTYENEPIYHCWHRQYLAVSLSRGQVLIYSDFGYILPSIVGLP